MTLYTLHPGAESDLDAACRWYKEKASGRLIARYLDVFDRVASLLVRAPELGTLHHHEFHPQFNQPRCQRKTVAPKATKLAHLALHRAGVAKSRLLDQQRHDMQHAVHIDPGHAPMQGSQSKVFHDFAPVVKVPNGTDLWALHGEHLSARKLGRRLDEASNQIRFGPHESTHGRSEVDSPPRGGGRRMSSAWGRH